MSVTPEVLAQYKAAADAKLEQVLAILDDPSWKQNKVEPEITFYTRTDPSSSFSQLKSVVEIPAPAPAVLAVLRTIEVVDTSTPKAQRHGYTARRAVFGPLDDANHSTILYVCLESPGPMVSGRDFLMSRFFYTLPGDRYVWLHTSIPHDALLPPVKGAVRGEMLFQAYVVEPGSGGSTKLTFLVHADPKGSVPVWAYNSTLLSQGYAAKGIRKRVLLGQQ